MSKLKKLLITFTAFALILSFSVFCIKDNYLKEEKQTEETDKNNSETDISTEDKLSENETEDNNDVRQEDLEDDSDKTQPEPPIEEQVLDAKKIILIISYDLSIEGDTSEIDFFSTIPQDYKYRQKILNTTFSPEPSNIFTYGPNTYAEFVIKNPDDKLTIQITCNMEIYDFDLLKASSWVSNLQNNIDFNSYLKEEEYIEVDDSYIQSSEIIHRLTEIPVDKVKLIYDYVLDNLDYEGYNPDSVGAVQALRKGSGDCTEYTDLMVTLCRASNFPARSIEGYTINAGNLSIGHNWTEVYINGYGWIPFDPTFDDGNGDSQNVTFSNLENVYVYMSFLRNDPNLKYYHYYYYNYSGDNIKVIKKITYNELI
jgi:hypothetical protein